MKPRRRVQRRDLAPSSVNITSMMDMMTIILVFLLNSFSGDAAPVAASERLVLPVARADAPPSLAVQVVVSRQDVRVDGEPVLSLTEAPDAVTGLPVLVAADATEVASGLPTLRARLVAKAERLAANAGVDGAEGVQDKLLVTSDASVPYSILKPVLYAAGEEGFGDFQFLVRPRAP